MSRKRIVLAEVQVGDTLPELPIPITSSLIVSGALALVRQVNPGASPRQAKELLTGTTPFDSRALRKAGSKR